MEINLLYLGAVAFGLLLIGVVFTVIEFTNHVDSSKD
jgi:hypothetical protein